MKKITGLLFLILSIQFHAFSQRAQDSLALVALYNATDGANWINKTNWLTPLPISSWFGVNVQNNRVTGLSLSNNNLKGSLPPEIGNLTKLLSLYLYNNSLTGLINLTGLTDLTNINVAYNLLDFTDLESAQVDWTKPLFIHSPQSLFLPLIKSGNSSDSTYTVDYSYPGTSFQWYKDGTEISGETFNSLIVPVSSKCGYACLVKHTSFPLLGLSSESAGVLHGGVTIADSLALVAFYNATGGINWTNKSNWLSTKPVSTWYGIKIYLGRVSFIELINNYLTGPLPVEIIGNLGRLTYLSLPGNRLGGVIPPEIGNLTNLITLNLSGNQLAGAIPAEIGNLSNLTNLILSNNQFGGTIPIEIWNMTKLTTLQLAADRLTGPIPATIGNLVNLINLTLSSNQLTGTIPTQIGNLTNLTNLSLYSNLLTGTIPIEFGNLTKLISLDLGANQLSGAIPSQIGNLTNLQSLYLNINQLSGSLPLEIGNLNKLFNLILLNNQLTDLTDLSGLTALASVNVSSNILDFSDLTTANINWTKPNYIYTPQILTLPVIRTVSGPDSIFTVNYSSPGTNFQWYKDGLTMIGQTNATLTIPASDPGAFYCIAKHNNFPALELSTASLGTLHGGVTLADSLALVALYNSTTGSGWTNRSNWLSTQPVSLWYGVKTSLGRVTQVNLSNNKLTGPIPSAIGNLANLTTLNLAGNKLSGSIPGQIGNLSNLTALELSSNTLTGTIPVQIGNLTKLTSLSLVMNQLSGAIPSEIGNLTNLINLLLYSNLLSGSIPAQIGNLIKLQALYLYGNQLSGVIPAQIGNLVNLSYLSLYNNQFTGAVPPEIGNLYKLNTLLLYNNKLTDLTNISSLTALASINVNSNFLDFSDLATANINWTKPNYIYSPQNIILPVIRTISDADSVYTVNYSSPGANFQWYKDGVIMIGQTNAALTVPAGDPGVFACIVKHSSFPALELSTVPLGSLHGGVTMADSLALVALYNATAGSGWTNKSNWLSTTQPVSNWYGIKTYLGRVSQINLPSNKLTGPLPLEIGNLTNLATLVLNNNKLSGSIPIQIGNLSNLTSLNLSGNMLTGTLPVQTGNLTNLTNLTLNNNQFNGVIPIEIGNLVNLQNLVLSGNQFIGSIPPQIGNLTKLLTLNLGWNQLDGEIPAQIGNLVNIQSLLLNNNQLYGELPIQIGNLSKMVSLNLSSNQLGGVLPEQIGNLTNLQYLNLSANYFNEEIPRQIGNLTRLNELVLNWNGFSGTIPTELGNLINLRNLNLSYNGFSGSIPNLIGNLTYLTTLDLSGNQFIGAIPSQIGNLINLIVLNVQNNQLSGVIPAQLGNLNKLTSLYLNNNRFTGLANLSGLTVLANINVNFNLLDYSDLATAQIDWNKPNYTYSGQDLILPVDFSKSGPNVTFTLDYAYPGTTFQWYKDFAYLPGQANISITVPGTDQGTYLCRANNSAFPYLVLESMQVKNPGSGVFLSDSLALRELFYSTDGWGWKNKTNWMSSQPVSTWYGVTVLNNRVTSIILNDNNLSGKIPADITYLAKLTDLNLSGNLITELPDISNLSNLVNINLSSNLLEFASLDNAQIDWSTSGFVYSPQNLKLPVDITSIGINNKFTVNYLYPGSSFQWYENDLLMTGKTSIYLTVPKSEINKYKCIARHASYPDLELLTETVQTVHGGVVLTDSLALVAFYNAMGGPGWTDNTNWLSNKPVSTWYGIEVTDYRVTYMEFEMNNLNGTLPSEIGDFSNLKGLYLWDDNITGAIPSEVTNLKSLEELILGGTNITGSIPAGLSNLNKLVVLAFAYTQINGTIPEEIWDISNLQELYLFDNNITGTISAKIGNLTNLNTLYLSNNQLSGTIPVELWNLTNLNELLLSNNQLSGNIPAAIGNLSNLSGLDLSSNQFTGNLPSQLWNLTSLDELMLSNNQFSGIIPSAIGNLTELNELNLNNNLFTGSVPSAINGITFLNKLKLNDNDFDVMSGLTLNYLDSLTIQGNRFTFEDIEPNMGIPNRFIYSPQDNVGTIQNITRNVGENYTFSVSVGGINNRYQWYKNDVLIPSATGSTLLISDLQFSDAGSYVCAVTNTLVTGLTIYSRAQVLTVSGTTEVNTEDLIGAKIYPNPSDGYLHIEINGEFAGKSKLEIRDLQGRLVFSKDIEFNNRQEIDLTSLPKGMYFIKIQDKNKNYFEKLIIQ